MTPIASVSRLAVSFAIVAAVFAIPAIAAEPVSSQAILQELKSFREMGSVLYVAAHPDDENTELIAYLARGRDYRTAYLSLTRGDGGQNSLGPEFSEKLGVARTQELLAARRIDGGRQFFSRAVDFGFSKDYRETLNVWDKQEVLSDIVRIIREFRPDVMVTRFSPVPGGTHGHHTASAVLALEAFKLAGDPKAFPEQGLPPWQAKRIFWNVSNFQQNKASGTNQVRIEIGGNDPVTGEAFSDIAGQSRSMHKTQGFGAYKSPGGAGKPRSEPFQLLDGAPATNDILDGVDTTWNRLPGGAEIGKQIDELTASVWKERKKEETRQLIQDCTGLYFEVTADQPWVAPGEGMTASFEIVNRSTAPLKITKIKSNALSFDSTLSPCCTL